MQRAVPPFKGNSKSESIPIKWALLPGLCCQAAGGDPYWADALSAAWFLFYIAAQFMDKVEDHDLREGSWQEWGAGTSINAASGLYFCASLLLAELFSQSYSSSFANELVSNFYRSCLRMSEGQHLDLTEPEPTLADYWNSVNLKSGTFFSMACRSGARLATSDSQKLDGYAEYGRNIGVLIQILDDLEEFQGTGEELGKFSFQVLRRSLPVIYALEVLPESERAQLYSELNQASTDVAAARSAHQRIDQTGAATYIIAEIARHRDLAESNLAAAQPSELTSGLLLDYLVGLTYQF